MSRVSLPSASVEVDGVELGEALRGLSARGAVEFIDAILEGLGHPEEYGEEAIKHLTRLPDLRAFVLYASGGRHEP